MYRIINFVNRKWNKSVFLFHDIATKTNISFLVKFSIWAHDRMVWQLPERVQLVGGIPISEHRLQSQLDLANHQIEYWMDYAGELQTELFNMIPDNEEEQEEPELATVNGQ